MKRLAIFTRKARFSKLIKYGIPNKTNRIGSKIPALIDFHSENMLSKLQRFYVRCFQKPEQSFESLYVGVGGGIHC